MGALATARDLVALGGALLSGDLAVKQDRGLPRVLSAGGGGGWGGEDGWPSERLARLYELSSWVRDAADLKADVLMRAPGQVYRRLADGSREPEPNHPFMSVWEDPNPVDGTADLQRRGSVDLDLHGQAYWYLVLDRSLMPAGLWPLDPGRVEAVPARDGDRLVDHYRFDGDRGSVRIPPALVVHFRNYSPAGPLAGTPTVRSIYPAIAGDVEAARWQQHVSGQAFRPPAAFSTTEEMDPEEARELSRDLMASFGGPANAGRPMILWAGLAPVKTAFTPHEADLVASRAGARDEILAGFRIGKGSLGIVDDVNRANAEALEYGLSRRVAEPALIRTAQRLTATALRPFWGSEWEFRFDGVVPIDEDRQLRKVAEAGNLRVVTKNEVRRLLFPELGDLPEGGDELAGKRAPAPPAAPPAGEAGEAEDGGEAGEDGAEGEEAAKAPAARLLRTFEDAISARLDEQRAQVLAAWGS